MTFLWVVVLAVAGFFPAVKPAQSGGLSHRLDLDHRQARFDLPRRLAEVSGLAFTPDGRLFAHDDEVGMVYGVDLTTGKVDRGFQVGETRVADDLEGLAIVGDRFFLVSSRGLLYEFREAEVGGWSPVRITDTGLGRGCEVEGLTVHSASGSLLLACKTLAPPAHEVRIHRLSLDPQVESGAPIVVAGSAFAALGYDVEVNPSAIDVDPSTGTLVLLAARQDLLFEIDMNGRLLDVVRLSKRRHPQPEGIAFGPGGRLFIGDERGGSDDARLTIYGPPTPGGR